MSVWNGGCPPAVLLGSEGEIANQFNSMHLPLGILAPDKFDDEVAHYHYGNRRCQLLLCSDGAVDTSDAGSMEIGMSRLLLAGRSKNMAERLPGMVKMLGRKLAGKPAHDDITLILMDCPAADREESAVPLQPNLKNVEINLLDDITVHRPCDHVANIEWQFALTLTAPQLRQTDIVPMLLHVVSQIEHEGMQELTGKVFLVLSELFNNALDHGLLGLDSVLKSDPLGMDLYFEERAARLGSLERGEIKIRLMKVFTAHEPCLKITVTDSGEGFDFQNFIRLPDVALGDGKRRYGRGIALVESMSGRLNYSDNGRKSHVCIPLRSTEQCAFLIPKVGGNPGIL